MSDVLTLRDHAFVAALTALAVNPSSDPERMKFLMEVAGEFRGALSDVPHVSRLALDFDLMARAGAARTTHIFDLRRDLAAFHEMRLGRAQDAIRRQGT